MKCVLNTETKFASCAGNFALRRFSILSSSCTVRARAWIGRSAAEKRAVGSPPAPRSTANAAKGLSLGARETRGCRVTMPAPNRSDSAKNLTSGSVTASRSHVAQGCTSPRIPKFRCYFVELRPLPNFEKKFAKLWAGLTSFARTAVARTTRTRHTHSVTGDTRHPGPITVDLYVGARVL